MNTRIPRPSRVCAPTIVALIALLIFPVLALAQSESGRISGTITDQNGAIIPGARHYPQIDHADVFTAVVVDFLRRKVKPTR